MRGIWTLLACSVATTALATGELETAMAPTEEPGAAQAVAATSVARAVITTDVRDREPVDSVSSIQNSWPRIAFFTEVVGMEGQQITHRWEYGGVVQAEVPFRIGGPRWRIYSTKNMLPGWIGEWTVTAIDPEGNVLARKNFRYVSADEPVPAAESEPGL